MDRLDAELLIGGLVITVTWLIYSLSVYLLGE